MLTIKYITCFSKIKHVFYTGLMNELGTLFDATILLSINICIFPLKDFDFYFLYTCNYLDFHVILPYDTDRFK